MTDNSNENRENEENFADLIESYSDRMSESIRIGEKIKGEIISIGKQFIFIDTGTKIDGVVGKEELLDENGEMPYKTGDVIELYVVSVDESEIQLSQALSGIGGIHLLEEAYRSRIPVEGRVKETCKGGFHVEVMQRRAFCPVSQMDLKYVETPDDYVGESFLFRITRFEENGKNVVVSRREILEKEQKEAEKVFFDGVAVGSELQGTVTRLKPFGAFVELIPGVEGMVHVSELSWSRLDKPDQAVKVGDDLQVKVIGIETDTKTGRRKIALSAKQLTGDPWDSVTDRFKPGDKIKGKVIRCANFGAFVEIAPGIEGLVHISEMSYTRRVMKPEEIVRPGETVKVMIKGLATENRRISLSIRDAEGDPWIEVPEKYRVGQAVDGRIEKKEKFGYFICLEPGITGLLPKSKIDRAPRPADIERLKEGDTTTVLIDEINSQERKITLSPGDAGETAGWQKYAAADNHGSLGSLGDKLRAALDAKKDN